MQKITKLEGMPTYDPNEQTDKFKIEKRVYEGKEVDVIYRKGNPGITLEEVEKMRAEGKNLRSQIPLITSFRSLLIRRLP